jgi:hypothetical protein
MVSVRQLAAVIVALALQAVQGISMWRPDSLGPIYERSAEDASLMVEVLHVLRHGGETKFGTSANHKLVERKIKKLAFMAQCLKEATWQKQHMKDARSKMKKKAALLTIMSYAGQADEELLDSVSLSRVKHIYKTPKYPFDPLMDGDFIVDADNYLEDFINASAIPKKLKDRYTTHTTTTTITNATSKVNTTANNASGHAAGKEVHTTVSTTVSKTVHTTVSTTVSKTVNTTVSTTAANATANPNMTTTATKKMSLVGVGNGCTTRADPHSERRWQFLFGLNTAAPGTPCIFGVVPADEGSHCMVSDKKYGSFGWCYTRPDRTEWGSCAEGCPLVGTEDVIAQSVDSLTDRVRFTLNKLGMTKCY